jgi:hypothetical protein
MACRCLNAFFRSRWHHLALMFVCRLWSSGLVFQRRLLPRKTSKRCDSVFPVHQLGGKLVLNKGGCQQPITSPSCAWRWWRRMPAWEQHWRRAEAGNKGTPAQHAESPSLVLLINNTKMLMPCVKCFELGISNTCDEGVCGKECGHKITKKRCMDMIIKWRRRI